MVAIQLPEFNVNYVEILITKEVPILIYVWLCLNIPQTGRYIGSFVLSISDLLILLPVCPVHYPVNHTQRIPVLELGGLLQEIESRVHTKYLLQQWLEIFELYVVFGSLLEKNKGPLLEIFIL